MIHGSEKQVLARLEKSPSHTIYTAYIERFNLDWRLWDAHLVRKAPDALAEGQVCHLRGRLQFDPAPRNA